MAEQYIELFGSTDEVHADDLALIVRHLSIRPGAVLDVGCGPGHLTAHLRSLGVDATGIDLVPEFIDHARAAHPDGRYELGSMHQLPVPDRSVAGILAWYSLIHLAAGRARRRARRAPAGDGPRRHARRRVLRRRRGRRLRAQGRDAYFWPVDELSARLRRAGFTEVERQRRPGAEPGPRPHAAIAAVVTPGAPRP